MTQSLGSILRPDGQTRCVNLDSSPQEMESRRSTQETQLGHRQPLSSLLLHYHLLSFSSTFHGGGEFLCLSHLGGWKESLVEHQPSMD